MPSAKDFYSSNPVVDSQDSSTDNELLTPEAFKQLLGQYKRAGYESIQLWYQHQNKLLQDSAWHDEQPRAI